MEIKLSTLMVELDCLLDTRLGTLFSLGEDIAEQALTSNYYDRQEDKFPGVETDIFRAKYKLRDVSTLRNSGVTQIIQLIKEFVVKTLNQSIVTPHHYIPKIVLNTYPYKLSDKEKDNFVKVLMYLTKEECQVETIHMTYEALTPSYVKQVFSVMLMYDYRSWLECHAVNNAFKTQSCPEVSLIAPAIFFDGPLKLEDKQILEKQKITPFKAVEMIAAPFVNLKLLPVNEFSFIMKLPKQPTE